jgi:putative membrane protein
MTAADLPGLNAALNGLATVFLLLGIVAIKREAKKAHGFLMGAAFATSCVFLISYVTHKILVQGVHTPFLGEGIWRPVYYVMLISHIILAIAVPPMAIITMRHALAGRYEAHRRLSKWTFPIWMYVGVTGVLVYFFLYRWFQPAA